MKLLIVISAICSLLFSGVLFAQNINIKINDNGNGVNMNMKVTDETGKTTKTTVKHEEKHESKVVVKEKKIIKPKVSAMSATSFLKLKEAIKKEDFSDGKLSILKEALAHNAINCDQAGKILDLFEYDSDRVKAGAVCHKSVVDPGNFSTVSSHF